MRKYDYDPHLFEDCDPYRIPYGEEGYDAFLDRPLTKLRLSLVCTPGYLEIRQAILDGRQERFYYEQLASSIRDEGSSNARRFNSLFSGRIMKLFKSLLFGFLAAGGVFFLATRVALLIALPLL